MNFKDAVSGWDGIDLSEMRYLIAVLTKIYQISGIYRRIWLVFVVNPNILDTEYRN